MAINNEDLESLNEQLRSLAEFMGQMVGQKAEEKELTEEQLAAQKGFIKDSSGNYKKIDTEYKKRTEAEKNRADLEKKVNDELDRQYTKTQQQHAKEEVVNLKREELFQKELKSISDVIEGSLEINNAQKRVIAEWKTSEAYLTVQRADMFKKQAEAMGGIVASNGTLLKNNGKIINTTAELSKEQQKQLAELKVSGAPGKAFGDMADKLNSTKAITGEFSNKIVEATKGSMGLTASYKLVSAGLEGVFNATKVMTKSLYEGERGAKVGAKAISEFADSVTTAMKGIGAAMMFIPGLGIAARIAGGALALLGMAAATAAEANKVAAEQNDKLFDSFNKLSEAGLTTAAGMTGVFETVQTLGMTTAELEKFNEMLMSSAKDLKMFGGTTAAGAKQFAEVAGELTKSAEFGEKLAQMGVTADAQREHTLKYMAQQTRLGLMQDKTQKDLVRGAAAYIEELDKMAMLTGATRKEQEEAQNAINAIEEIRAAMEDAANRGDKVEQARLKKYYDLSVDLQQQGLTRGAGGVAKLGAAGGGPTDEASSAAYIQFSKALDAIKAGKSREEVLLEAAKGSKEQMRELAAAKAVGSDLSGLQTDKTGTNIDFYNRILKSNEEATKQNISLSEYLKKEADAKTGSDADKRTKDNVEATRMQQAAAQQLDSIAWTFNAAAKLNKDASDMFNKAVTKFSNTVGAKPIAGGEIQTKATGSTTAPPSTATTVPTTGPAREARKTTQTNLETATATREKAEKASGRGSQEAIDARLAEAKARLEAEKARRPEETATRNAARGLPAPKPATTTTPASTPKSTTTPTTTPKDTATATPTTTPKDTAIATPTAVPVKPKDTATPVTRSMSPTAVPVTSKDTATPTATPTAVPVTSKDTATPVTRSMSPTAVPVKSKDTATPVTRSMSPSTVPATAPITQQKQMGESSELSKVEKELNRFTKSNNMQHQSNKDYVANLESKRKQLLAVGGNVPEPTLPQDSTKTATATATATVTKPDDVMRLIKFQGDALGDKTHFEALDPAVKDSFINMIAEYGKPVQINAAMRDVEEQQQMWDDAKPDPNNPNKRRNSQGNPVAPPGRSRHNYGRALDLNRNQVSDLASTGLLTKYGFNTIPNDPPHIEMAKMGGVFDGPESGYPVMLHGKEAVVPENQLKAVKTLLENVTKENLSSELPTITATPTTTTASDSDSRLLVDLYNIMDDKFSTMISILTSSNDVQAELLKHSRV
jgi:hypothetical protein